MTAPRRPRPLSARPAHDAAVATEQAAAVTVDDVGAGPGAAAAEITEVAAAKTVGAVASAEDTARAAVVHQTAAEVRTAQRRLRIFIIAAAVVVLLLNLLALLWFVNAQVETAKEDVTRALLASRADAMIAVLAAAVDASRADAIAKGQPPAVPSADTLVAGVQQAQPVGPTDEQIRSAVTLYLLANPPQPGRAPTDAEVERAVAVYCASNNCRGDTGATGASGAGGTNGANGAPGPGPTDQQVADAVAAFCSTHNNCTPAPVPGPQGPPGPECAPGYTPTDQPAPLPATGTWRVCTANP